jgi:hypothetical protein
MQLAARPVHRAAIGYADHYEPKYNSVPGKLSNIMRADKAQQAANGEYCGKLDCDLKHLAFLVVQVQQLTHPIRMTGTGNRQKFGQALYFAEDGGF